MSDIVNQIFTEIDTITSATLGGTFHKLRHVFDISKNDFRTAKNGYGILHKSSITSEGVTRVYTQDQAFEIILTKNNMRTSNDDEIQIAINALYNQTDEILKAMINKKLNLPALILNIFDPSISEPEFLDENQVIVLRFQVLVKYRSVLN